MWRKIKNQNIKTKNDPLLLQVFCVQNIHFWLNLFFYSSFKYFPLVTDPTSVLRKGGVRLRCLSVCFLNVSQTYFSVKQLIYLDFCVLQPRLFSHWHRISCFVKRVKNKHKISIWVVIMWLKKNTKEFNLVSLLNFISWVTKYDI